MADPSPNTTGQVDDDLITYDENDGTEWIQHTSSHSTPSLKPSVGASAAAAIETTASHHEAAGAGEDVAEPTGGLEPELVDLGDGDQEIDWDLHDGADAEQEEADTAAAGGIPDDGIVANPDNQELHYDGDGNDDFNATDPVFTGNIGGSPMITGLSDSAQDMLFDTVDADHDAGSGSVNPAPSHVSGGSSENVEDEVLYDEYDDDADDPSAYDEGEHADDDDGMHQGAADQEDDADADDGEDVDQYDDDEVVEDVESGGPEDESDEGVEEDGDDGDDGDDDDEDSLVVVKEVTIVESQDDNSSVAAKVPHIIVHYDGREYPFFQGSPWATLNRGFFDNLQMLDYKMDRLLRCFRMELGGLCPADWDVVLHFDELCLEYSQSTDPEILGNISLRQLLKVFKKLVKNEELDSTRCHRPLFVYLFTRANPRERWESLTELAGARSSIFSHAHYFKRSVHNATSHDFTQGDDLSESDDDTASDYYGSHGRGEGLDDEFDKDGEYRPYWSPSRGIPILHTMAASVGLAEPQEVDDGPDDGDMSNAPTHDDPGHDDDHAQDVEPRVAVDQAQVEEAAVGHAYDDIDFTNADDPDAAQGYNGNAPSSPCFQPWPCFCATCVERSSAEFVRQDQAFRQEIHAGHQLGYGPAAVSGMQAAHGEPAYGYAVVVSLVDHDGLQGNEQGPQADGGRGLSGAHPFAQHADQIYQAYDDGNEFGQLSHVEEEQDLVGINEGEEAYAVDDGAYTLDDEGETYAANDDEDRAYTVDDDADAYAVPMQADHHDPGADGGSKVTSTTSATATLTGEDEIDFGNGVENENEVAAAQAVDADEDEIHWADGEEVQTDEPITGKRQREEDGDDGGEDEQKDFKRRRS